MGQFFKQYLEPIKLNDVHVCKTSHVIHYAFLLQGNILLSLTGSLFVGTD
jgi:hypothetical protein